MLEEKKVHIPEGFPISTVAHISEGWSVGSVRRRLEKNNAIFLGIKWSCLLFIFLNLLIV